MQVTRQSGGAMKCRNIRSAGPRECIQAQGQRGSFRPVRRGRCPLGQVQIDNRCVRRPQPGTK